MEKDMTSYVNSTSQAYTNMPKKDKAMCKKRGLIPEICLSKKRQAGYQDGLFSNSLYQNRIRDCLKKLQNM